MEQIQQRFAVQQQRLLNIKQLIDENRAETQAHLTVDLQQTVDTQLSQQRFRYLQHLKIQVQKLTAAYVQEEKTLNAIREEMRLAHVKKKSLELLAQKQEKDYLNVLEAQEIKETEDIVLARRHRSQYMESIG